MNVINEVPQDVINNPNDYMTCFCSECCQEFYRLKSEYINIPDLVINNKLCDFCSESCYNNYMKNL